MTEIVGRDRLGCVCCDITTKKAIHSIPYHSNWIGMLF